MSKIILGLDLDGILYDWHSALYTFYQYTLYYDGTFNEFWLNHMPSLSKEKQDYLVSIPIPYETQVPTNSTIEFLEFCKNNADDIYYITHRPTELERITKRYFKRYDFPYPDNLFMTGDKLTTCRYLGVTHFIDDFVKHVDAVSQTADAYLMAKPWNRESREKYNTVSNLKEFQDRVFS